MQKIQKKSLPALEYDKIISSLQDFAATEGAKEAIASFMPETEGFRIQRLLDETGQALELIDLKGLPAFGGIRNVIPSCERARKGAVLTNRELLDVAGVLRTASSLRKYGTEKCADPLSSYFSALEGNKTLENKISSSIQDEELFYDNASDNLLRIRRDITRCEQAVRNRLSSIITGASAKFLQESIVTVRSGRFVVPVKAEHKNDIKGLVHDTSSSGSPLFIEPMSVVEENNRLRELKGKEKDEIERILSELSALVAESADSTAQDYRTITDIAVIFAKAAYSASFEGRRPIINTKNKRIKLIKARHPLIKKEDVVPISVEFGDNESTLIVTGPNTGGKTVMLKTLGLFSLMMSTGLFLPCDDGSMMPVFGHVFADIGDEQSIEQSLSTFSSHMVNIADILSIPDHSRSLILLDELGAGTDPVEGAALAVSILEHLKERGAIIASTTHYSELKIYAMETPGVLNASCEFDVETLKPTYRLITGLPGKSNAFAISLRLGISADIIDRARDLMAEDSRRFEDIISRLEQTESEMQKEKEKAGSEKRQADAQLREAKELARRTTEKAEQELEKARVQAQRILTQAKKASEAVFDEVNKLRREKEKENARELMEKARSEVRTQLKNAETDAFLYEIEDGDEDYVLPREILAGDEVILRDIKKQGRVKSVAGNAVVVAVGIAEIKTTVNNLMLAGIPEKEKKPRSTTSLSVSSGVKNEIDVRGQTGDDAWFIIDRFLDEPGLLTFENVYIIHGKGTGALRTALWKLFRTDKRIESFRSGRYGEGDTGVTVLTLKKK